MLSGFTTSRASSLGDLISMVLDTCSGSDGSTASLCPKNGSENGVPRVGCGLYGSPGVPVHVGAGVQVGTGVHVAAEFVDGGTVGTTVPAPTVGKAVGLVILGVAVGVIVGRGDAAVGAVVGGRGVLVGGCGIGVFVGGLEIPNLCANGITGAFPPQ